MLFKKKHVLSILIHGSILLNGRTLAPHSASDDLGDRRAREELGPAVELPPGEDQLLHRMARAQV